MLERVFQNNTNKEKDKLRNKPGPENTKSTIKKSFIFLYLPYQTSLYLLQQNPLFVVLSLYYLHEDQTKGFQIYQQDIS